MSVLRQCPCSPPPLEDDDLLSEILLRLPPLPSSLPRASAVCKRWRRLVSDPGFSRRFRRRNPPPLLGFFGQAVDGIIFEPTMDPPNRVAPGRFSTLPDARVRSRLLACRHGLVLILHQNPKQVLVWDPVAGDQHRLAVPPGFDTGGTLIVGTVRRAVGGGSHHFQVALAGSDKQHQDTRAFACIYSSEAGVWSDLISTLLPSGNSMYIRYMPAVLAGDSFYWMLNWTSRAILELNLGRQSLSVIHLPVYKFAHRKPWDTMLMRTEGGGLGLLFLSDFTARLWKMNTEFDGVASWVLGRTVELDRLLSLNLEEERKLPRIVGFAEYNNAVFLCTVTGLFLVQLESLQFKKLSKPSMVSCHHPFESVYAAGV